MDRLETFHSVSNKIKCHMYIVKAADADEMNLITLIFGICNIVCKWEHMKKREVTQCFNCYDFGHSQGAGCLNLRKCKRCLVIEPNHECKVELVKPSEENRWRRMQITSAAVAKNIAIHHSKCNKYMEAINKAKSAQQARNARR